MHTTSRISSQLPQDRLTTEQRKILLQHGLSLLRAGINLIPVDHNKQPAVSSWKEYQTERVTPEKLAVWVKSPKTSGLAIVCGEASGGNPGYGLTVIDIDEESFLKPFQDLCSDILADLPMQRSGGGGYHIAFRSPMLEGNAKLAWVPNETSPMGRTVAMETRGQGGYILCAHSYHESGNFYEEIHLSYTDIPTLTLEQATRLIKAAQSLDQMPLNRVSQTNVEQVQRKFEQYRGGGGTSVIDAYNDSISMHDALINAGYTQYGSRYTRPGEGASPGSVVLLKDRRGRWCSFHHSSNDPMNDGKPHDQFDIYVAFTHNGSMRDAVRQYAQESGMSLQRTTKNQAGHKSPKKGALKTPEIDEYGTPTEDDTAQEEPKKLELLDYLDFYLEWLKERDQIHVYHQERSAYYRYDRGVYRAVTEEEVLQGINDCLKERGFRNMNGNMITQIGLQYRRMREVGRAEEDIDPMELNTRNGILDLRTLGFKPHDSKYFSTIQSQARYQPEKVAYDFLEFLENAVPKESDRLILQMFAGLCLTGDTSPQRALLLIGDGGTGKGTLMHAFSEVLGGMSGGKGGSLATSSSLENIKDGSFLVGNLVGKRMCVISELNPKVDWLPFKRVTGEDPITVDVKNRTPYVTKLDIKLIILSNTIPFMGADSSNTSLTRRFLIVPFNVKPSKKDAGLRKSLTTPDELSGILNWMIEGLQKLVEANMEFPESPENPLLLDMQEKSNHVISYAMDHLEPGGKVGASELYEHYRNWAERNGFFAFNIERFKNDMLPAAMKHLGWTVLSDRNKHGKVWDGIRLILG